MSYINLQKDCVKSGEGGEESKQRKDFIINGLGRKGFVYSSSCGNLFLTGICKMIYRSGSLSCKQQKPIPAHFKKAIFFSIWVIPRIILWGPKSSLKVTLPGIWPQKSHCRMVQWRYYWLLPPPLLRNRSPATCIAAPTDCPGQKLMLELLLSSPVTEWILYCPFFQTIKTRFSMGTPAGGA